MTINFPKTRSMKDRIPRKTKKAAHRLGLHIYNIGGIIFTTRDGKTFDIITS